MGTFLIKHHNNFKRANDELQLYRDDDEDSEMAYKKWTDLFLESKDSIDELYVKGKHKADEDNVTVGTQKYLWADAIADKLFDEWANKRYISRSKRNSR